MDRNGIDPHPVIPELERWKGEEEEKKIYIWGPFTDIMQGPDGGLRSPRFVHTF
jgi:hypothetical protein